MECRFLPVNYCSGDWLKDRIGQPRARFAVTAVLSASRVWRQTTVPPDLYGRVLSG